VNFDLLAAEIGPVVWGIPTNFNGFRALAALLHGTQVVRQPHFAALNRWRHLCSAGRPSGWALAHILVFFYFSALSLTDIVSLHNWNKQWMRFKEVICHDGSLMCLFMTMQHALNPTCSNVPAQTAALRSHTSVTVKMSAETGLMNCTAVSDVFVYLTAVLVYINPARATATVQVIISI